MVDYVDHIIYDELKERDRERGGWRKGGTVLFQGGNRCYDEAVLPQTYWLICARPGCLFGLSHWLIWAYVSRSSGAISRPKQLDSRSQASRGPRLPAVPTKG